jgi:sulfonate transport system substrate-binding protein
MNTAVSKKRLVLFALSLLLGACAREKAAPRAESQAASSTPAPAAEPKATTVVKLGYQKIGPPFLLKERSEGLKQRLAKSHTTAEWIEFKHGPALLEAVNANEVDIGYVGETPPVFAQAGGVSFVYVATDPPAPRSEAIVVPKGSPLQKVADLKGKKVALNRGSNVHYLLVRALESAKLTVKDVEVVYLAPPDARAAFETGKVDAWVIWDPFLASAELAGARSLVNGENLVDNHLFYVVRRAFAEKEPALVREVLDEYRALSGWESEHPEESARLLAKSSGVSYEALLVAEKRHAYGLLPITPELLQKQQRIADTFRKLELIPKEIRTTDAFLPAAAYQAKL